MEIRWRFELKSSERRYPAAHLHAGGDVRRQRSWRPDSRKQGVELYTSITMLYDKVIAHSSPQAGGFSCHLYDTNAAARERSTCMETALNLLKLVSQCRASNASKEP